MSKKTKINDIFIRPYEIDDDLLDNLIFIFEKGGSRYNHVIDFLKNTTWLDSKKTEFKYFYSQEAIAKVISNSLSNLRQENGEPILTQEIITGALILKPEQFSEAYGSLKIVQSTSHLPPSLRRESTEPYDSEPSPEGTASPQATNQSITAQALSEILKDYHQEELQVTPPSLTRQKSFRTIPSATEQGRQ